MKDLAGKLAVVTGAGSGIGEALALAFAAEGMHVVAADIDAAAAQRVADAVSERGVRSLAVATDVADFDSVRSLAEQTRDALGPTDVLCNNAGVLLMGAASESSIDDWRWLLSVNLMGVVHGVTAFLPDMLERGAPAHIVNTASVAAIGGGGVYGASKAAVLSYSESLRDELSEREIGVSVLCPSFINSKILASQRNRPEGFGPRASEPFGNAEVTTGLPASRVAEDTLAAIRDGRFHVFTLPRLMHERTRSNASARFEAILEAIEHGVHPDP